MFSSNFGSCTLFLYTFRSSFFVFGSKFGLHTISFYLFRGEQFMIDWIFGLHVNISTAEVPILYLDISP